MNVTDNVWNEARVTDGVGKPKTAPPVRAKSAALWVDPSFCYEACLNLFRTSLRSFLLTAPLQGFSDTVYLFEDSM